MANRSGHRCRRKKIAIGVLKPADSLSPTAVRAILICSHIWTTDRRFYPSPTPLGASCVLSCAASSPNLASPYSFCSLQVLFFTGSVSNPSLLPYLELYFPTSPYHERQEDSLLLCAPAIATDCPPLVYHLHRGYAVPGTSDIAKQQAVKRAWLTVGQRCRYAPVDSQLGRRRGSVEASEIA